MISLFQLCSLAYADTMNCQSNNSDLLYIHPKNGSVLFIASGQNPQILGGIVSKTQKQLIIKGQTFQFTMELAGDRKVSRLSFAQQNIKFICQGP